MKWITRDHVHMDRVATPWVILRFVDPDAEFTFLPIAKTLGATLDPSLIIPEGAIPFALPGVELGPHDDEGSTFRKVMLKYELDNSALEMMAQVIESGVEHVFHHTDPGYSVAKLKHTVGVGLDALALGRMYDAADDVDNIKGSMIIYDALYAYCAGAILEATKPELAALPIPDRWDAIKKILDQERPWVQ